MPAGNSHADYPIKVRSTEIVATDTPRQYREKLARIALDEMYQFVAVLDAGGDFADGVIAYEGSWLGADTFVSFDKKTVRLMDAQGGSARLLS